MEFETGQDLQNRIAAQPGVSSGVSSFLAWLMIWLRVCTARPGLQFGHRSAQAPVRTYQPNRHWRRFGGRDVPPVRNNRPYFILAGRGLTSGQFTEWLAHYSGRGRVSVYRMRYWRKTVKGKAAPLGTEHEYWRDPLGRIGGRMSNLLCGVWHAHLWPGWRVLPITLNILTPAKTSRVNDDACLDSVYPHFPCTRLNKNGRRPKGASAFFFAIFSPLD